MQRTETSNGEFREFLDATGYARNEDDLFLRSWRGANGALPIPVAPPAGHEDYPVVWVDLFDAEAYAAWAGLRVPTQREWEDAASYGTTGEYPFGFFRPLCANTLELGLGHATPVGMFENGKSVLGAYDLAGNVGEWTLGDWAPVIKGGSFNQAARRIHQPEDQEQIVASRFRAGDVGFRCVQDTIAYLGERILGAGLDDDTVLTSLRGFLRRGGEPARRVLEALAASRPAQRGLIHSALELGR